MQIVLVQQRERERERGEEKVGWARKWSGVDGEREGRKRKRKHEQRYHCSAPKRVTILSFSQKGEQGS